MENGVQDFVEVPEMNVEYDEDVLFSQDSNHLRLLLPETIWRSVTSKLAKCPDVITKFANSSPYFRDLSSSKRTLFLFDNVLSVVTLRLWKKKGINGLPFSNVLKCRQVCSLWNGVVDKHLTGKKFLNPRLPNAGKKALESKSENLFDASDEQVFDFLTHFEETHCPPDVVRNPFIWNNLSVITINDENGIIEDDQEHLDAVSLVLRKYGHFIHEFKLEIGGGALFVEDAFKLQEWLAHMPNLKSLEIVDETPCFEDNITLIEFQDRLTAANFPQFTKLDHLKSVNFKNVSAPILNLFIQENHHIKKLLLAKCDDNYDFFTFPFQNLTLFDIAVDSVEIFEKLKNSSQVPWPKVKHLSIFFSPNETATYFIPLEEIFQVIQAKFKSKLDTIYLELPKARNAEEADSFWMDSVNCRLVLPNLLGARFTFKDPMSLDFLLEMKDMLEEILLYIEYPISVIKVNNSETPSTVVQLNGFEKNIRASNIPKLFTNLDRIGIDFDNRIKWYDL